MANRMIQRRLRFGAVVLAAGLLAALTAGTVSGGVKAQAKACSGTPVRVTEIVTLTSPVFTNFPEYAAGAKAAAYALTKSCALGRPIQAVICDDKFDPNTAQQCAREAVANKSVAVLYTGGAYGDQIMTITDAAGIPELGLGSSTLETTNALSFPVVQGTTVQMASGTILTSAGSRKIADIGNDLPVVPYLQSFGDRISLAFGAKVSHIPVPVTTVDMSPFAAQILAGGYDGIFPILDGAKLDSLLKSLVQQGANFKKLRFVDTLSNLTPASVTALGPSYVSGLLMSSIGIPLTDTSNPAIQQLRAALKATGQSTTQGVYATVGWGSMQVVAAALAGQKTMTAKTVATQLAKGVVTPKQFESFGLPPFNYTQPAFPKDKALSKLRIFSRYEAVYRMNAQGLPVRATKAQWVDVTRKFTLLP